MASFKEAFAAARAAKKATFDWNGKKYTTQMKGEAAGKTQRPKTRTEASSPRPKARPSNDAPKVMSEAPKQGVAPKASGPLKTAPASKGAAAPSAKAKKDTPKISAAKGGGFGDKKQNSFISTLKGVFTGKGGFGDKRKK